MPITAHAALSSVLKALPNRSKGTAQLVINCFVKRSLFEKYRRIYRIPKGKAITRQDINEIIRELREV
ncbi:MAG: hypothetical protein H0X31_06115 [Nostocaceae cyanobacterium]|nr:hypothetical protein [Nostocaceae cyanobacterium]